jgi:short-subunit dehydrogenase
MMSILKEKYGAWVLITGATSGIGKAFACHFVSTGFNCLLISNDVKGLENTRSTLLKLNPSVEIRSVNLDLNNIQAVDNFLQTSELDLIRIVINCAGVGKVGAVINNTLNEYLPLININAISPFIISYHFADYFFKHNYRGAIINITTANSEIGYPIPYCSVYTPLKCFVKLFTEGLAFEMKPYGIDILNVACGPTDTNFQNTANTNRLSWCETPQKVVTKSLAALGKKTVIITNPVSKILIALLKYLPLSRNIKINIAAYFYGKILGGGRHIELRR